MDHIVSATSIMEDCGGVGVRGRVPERSEARHGRRRTEAAAARSRHSGNSYSRQRQHQAVGSNRISMYRRVEVYASSACDRVGLTCLEQKQGSSA